MPADSTIRTKTVLSLMAIIVVAFFIGYRASQGWFTFPFTPAPALAPANQPAQATTTPTVTTSSSVDLPSGTDTNLPEVEPTYQESKYLTDYHFQFDDSCHGSAGLPMQGSLNVKQGAVIVLENHGTASRRIALGNTAYQVAAGGFTVANAPSVKTTTGLYITCDGKGAGRLYVYP